MESLKIISLNVRGIADRNKGRGIFDFYRKQCDVLCLQETHSTPEVEAIWTSKWGGRILFAHGSSSSGGVMILFNKTKFYNIWRVQTDLDGCFIICDVDDCENDHICIINLYAPNTDNPGFFKNLLSLTDSNAASKILIGDFNLILDENLDQSNRKMNNKKSSDFLKSYMQEHFLVDVWRIRNPDIRRYSWFRNKPNRVASRLDMAIVSDEVARCVPNIMYFTGLHTDHSALFLAVEFSKQERGVGYWKFNCNLLSDIDFVQYFNVFITEKIQELEAAGPNEKWERLKCAMRDEAIKYANQKIDCTKRKITELREVISNKEECWESLSEQSLEQLESEKAELISLQEERTKGLIFRSKARWVMEAERNTRYFYNLEKARYNSKTCQRLLTEEGEVTTDPDQILSMQWKFYQELYSADPTVEFTLQNTSGVAVPENSMAKSTKQIAFHELTAAVRTLKNGRMPGSDGLPADLYKMFWKDVGPVLYGSVISSFKKEMLHGTARSGVLNLIPKPNKDARYLKNLRPITLLNTDYKILEKAIAIRLQSALEQIINMDQKGFMPGRRISANIRKMFDVLNAAEQENFPGLVLNVDWSKAFDKVETTAILGSMKYFQFAEILIQWTRILYKNFSVRIQNNGNFSEKIDVTRSIHQGGCASTQYFIICAELLAIEIRKNGDVKGIPIRDFMYILSQYTDDMDDFLEADEKSVRACLKTIEEFKCQTGLSINYDKTSIYRIGSLRHSDASMFSLNHLKWTNDSINVLGIEIDHDNNKVLQRNYAPCIVKTRNVLTQWKNRNLSLLGKINIINTLVSSLFIYKMMVLPRIPQKYVDEVEKLCKDFIWPKATPKIKLQILQVNRKHRGLNLTDLTKKDDALKISWLHIARSDLSIQNLMLYALNTPLGEDIWRCNLVAEDVDLICQSNNLFWKDVLKAWCRYNYTYRQDVDQVLWLNSNIRINDQPFIMCEPYKKGLMWCGQLYEEGHVIGIKKAQESFGMDLMQYNSVISAIPRVLKNELRQGDIKKQRTYSDFIQKGTPTKVVYNTLTENYFVTCQKSAAWEDELGIQIVHEEFLKLFKAVNEITIVPKLRSLQYRLLIRAVSTNIHLKHWKIKSSDMCSFCGKFRETYVHLFVECDHVIPLWAMVQEKLASIGINIVFTKENIIFNVNRFNNTSIANVYVIITKQYIYASRNPLNCTEIL